MQDLAASCQLSAIGYRLSVIGCRSRDVCDGLRPGGGDGEVRRIAGELEDAAHLIAERADGEAAVRLAHPLGQREEHAEAGAADVVHAAEVDDDVPRAGGLERLEGGPERRGRHAVQTARRRDDRRLAITFLKYLGFSG